MAVLDDDEDQAGSEGGQPAKEGGRLLPAVARGFKETHIGFVS